jgi:cyanoexosortase B-associated protein
MSSLKIPAELTLVFGARKRRIPINYVFLSILLVTLIIGGILPNLVSGQWNWLDVPRISNMQQMNTLQKSGIEIPGLATIDRREVQIGEGEWSAQILERDDGTRMTLLLKPQDYYKDNPEVEWSDIKSIARWKTAQTTDLTFPSSFGGRVTARFDRASQQNTFAVVQWYAWLGGGHYDPSVWYWSDQWAQLKGKRIPWIAVSLHIPLDPSKDLKTLQPFALDLATRIQNQLEQRVLSKLSTPHKVKIAK